MCHITMLRWDFLFLRGLFSNDHHISDHILLDYRIYDLINNYFSLPLQVEDNISETQQTFIKFGPT